LILAYQGLEEENLDQKPPGPLDWGVSAAGQPTAHRKNKLAKKPIGNFFLLKKTGMTEATGGRRLYNC